MFRNIATGFALMTLAAVSSEAHHSFAAEFDYDRTGTLEGEVIEVLYVNPHTRYFLSITADDGTETIWDTQTRSSSALTRVGWTRDTIKVGDRVEFEGNLGRENTRKLWIREARVNQGPLITPTEGEAPE